MKKTIFFLSVLVIVFLIYIINTNNKIYYLSVGDYLSYGINDLNNTNNNYSESIKKNIGKNLKKYVNYSTIDDYRVNDLINDINYNKEILYENKSYRFQNLLVKANYITLSIGMNDLIYKKKLYTLNYEYIDELLLDVDNLFRILRNYNKDKIYFLSFYNIINNKEIVDYSNKKLKLLCEKYKINFIDISNLNKYIKKMYPSTEGYTYITKQILNFTK